DRVLTAAVAAGRARTGFPDHLLRSLAVCPLTVRSTREVAETLLAADRRSPNHAVPVTQPLELPDRDLPVPADVLGAQLAHRRESADTRIPSQYLRASRPQRMALLAGLLDTAGTGSPIGSVQFISTSARFAADVRELVVSLGYRCGFRQARVASRARASSI